MTRRSIGILVITFLAVVWMAPYASAQGTITDLNPSTAAAGAGTFTLAIDGSFVAYTVAPTVNWTFNGITTSLALVDTSLSVVTALVPASLLTTPGIASVVIVTPAGPTNSANFIITGAPLTITSISPSTALAGGPAFTLTVNGTNFYPSTVVTWNGSPLTTTYSSANQLSAAVPASLIATNGVDAVDVTSPEQTSPSAVAFNVIAPLVLTSISPNTAIAGGPSFTLLANGSGFSTGAVVTWNGASVATTFVSTTQLSAAIPASLITTAGTASVAVTAKGETSTAPLTFTILAPLMLTSISPNSATAGGPALTLNVLGSGFTTSTVVTWNGSSLATGFLSPGQLSATVPATLIASAGTASVGVAAPGQTSPSPLPFSIIQPLMLTSLSPASAVAGGPTFTLTLNGAGFSASSVAYWITQPLTTSFTNSTLLTATVPASLIASVGSASITVQSGGQISNALTFSVTATSFTLTSISPNSATAGGPTFTLTANGSGFTARTLVTWNGSVLATSFVSGSQLTATVPASFIASAGSASVAALNGTLTSNALPFTITAPLILTSISPNSATAGGPTFTLTANGSGFTAGTVVTWNGSVLASSVVSGSQLIATVPASFIASAGSASVAALNGTLTSNALPFTITAPLILTSISPNSATAGGPTFTLTANGSGFTAGTVVTWNGSVLASSVVSGSQLIATVPASFIASAGSASVAALNGTQTSNALPFTITATPLTLTSISPNSATAGGPTFTLTALGSGFTASTVVTWNGNGLATSVVSGSQLTATVPASLIASAGSASVAAQNGTQISNALPFTINPPGLTITSISPNTAVAGGPSFTLIANGSGFTANTIVTWNGSSLITTFVSANQLSAAVPTGLIAFAGTASVGVSAPGQASPSPLPFTITAATLTLTSLSPNSAVAGGPAFTMTINGSGFNATTNITWNGNALATTLISGSQFTATVPASFIATPGTASIVAQSGSLTSNALPFTITPSGLTLTSISPNSATAGGPAFTLVANGTGFTAGTVVTWNGTALATTFVSATQLNASVPANLITTMGTASVAAQNGTQNSNALTFVISSPVLSLTSISPNSVVPGGPAFTLTVNGTAFTSSTIVTWNGSSLTTTFVSSTQLTAAVPANLIANSGSASVDVSVPGQTSPTPLTFTIAAPPPPTLTITGVTPGTVPAGSATFTLLVNGTLFNTTTIVFWNTTPLATTFLNSSQMTAVVPASLIVQPGSAAITAQNGTTVSNAVTFNISAATLSLTSISPNSAIAGGPAFTLTANGSGFVSSTQVTWNGSPLVTAFVSTTQLTAAVPATLIASVGTASVGVTSSTPAPPAPLPFTITSFGLTSLSPATAVAAGPAFTLTANGSGFTSGTVLMWNRTPLTTTVVSPTQLTASVSASLIALPGTVSITATNSIQVSNALTFTITAPPPVITSLSPASVVAASPAFTMTVTGTGFLSGAVVSLNGSALTTNFVSATQVTAVVPAASITQPGTAQITLTNPTGQASNTVALTITPPIPTITSLAPSTVILGSAAFTLTVNGTAFFPGATVYWNGAGLNTTFVSATQVTAAVPANLILQPATIPITATNTGTAMSNAVNFTVMPPVPTITSISPASVAAGSPAFTLTVTGTNFFSGATVSLNGTALATTFVSNTQLTAAVPATSIAQPGAVPVTAANTGTASSNAVSLTITSPPPVLTSISPSTTTQGGPAFTLTVNGTGFLSGATVSLGATALATTFVSATQVTALVPASLIAQPGPQPVTATNPGSAASNPLPLAVNPPVPTITSISPSTVTVGGPGFTLTVIGTNFLPGATVSLNSMQLNSTAVSSTQITAQVTPNLIGQPGTAQITVANMNGSPSNAVALTISSATTTLTSISPSSANVGDPTFTMTLTGTGFVSNSMVQWGGSPLITTFVSSTQLTASVNSGRLIAPGTVSVFVSSPGPTPGPPLNTNSLTFTINPVIPAISSISPNSASAGAPALTLTVNGSGFINLTVIQWNTTALTTQYVSANQVTANVPATLLAQPGTAQITALNPGNNVSSAVTFTVNPSVPAVISSLSKTSATAGDAAFPLTVNGTGFISSAVVNFGTNALATSFVSATQLTAAVPVSLLLTPGTFPVVVQQAGTSSNAISFVVNLPASPSLRLNPPTAIGPAQQPIIDFGLNAPYPIPLSATVTLSFVSNATVPIVDPAIQFLGGGTSMTFAIPANTTTLPVLQISTGTVAGTITISVALTAAGVNVTPSSGSTATIVIGKLAPVILAGKVNVVRANGYLEVDITGYSTTRDMTQAVFTLNPVPNGSFTSSVLTVPLSSIFSTWYQSAASTAFGSQFTYTQTFTVIGDVNQVQSVTVTLTNSAGTSASMTSN